MATEGRAEVDREESGGRKAGRTARAGAPHGFACSPESHQICVIDRRGRLLEVFGQRGPLPGQFDSPSDVIIVSPRFQDEDAPASELRLVAVADRGNRRIQVFEPEGQLVAIIEGDDTGAGEGRDVRAGWPFFRVGSHGGFGEPVRLEWAAPALVVIGADGTATHVDLASALLPTFERWLASASTPMLVAAHHHFRHKVRRDMLAAPLAAIETALGCAGLAAGEVDAVARLWSSSWPAALAREAREMHAAERMRATTVAAFRWGGLGPVMSVRAAIRQSLGAFAALPLLESDRGGRASREAS